MPTPRQAALSMLNQVLNEERLLSESAAQRALEGLDGASKARAMRLANETLRNLERADKLLKSHLRKPPAPYVMNLLRLSTIELAQGGDAHGVVNEAVTLVSKHKKYGAMKGLVNAVLRKVAAEAPEKIKILRAPRLPKWLRGPLTEAYSSEIVGAMEVAHLAGAPLDLSVKSDPAGWAAKLGGTLTPMGSVRLPEAGQVSALEGFETGDWWVQDTAAALPAKLLNARKGETVLDMCCAPGGKTMQLAASGAEVTALDASETRLKRVRENLTRTGLKATVVCEDALTHTGAYDAVLLDAPCSATGTLRRHPDLPHAKTGENFGALIELQARMLAHAAGLVKSGGRLVFCTCSLLPDEGEVQVEDFLETHPEFTADTEALARDGIDAAWITEEGGLRLRPDYFAEIGGMDGFYMAVLKRA
ncbi:RsmB/NOP family class I SAM-dependent RNA methyltransferase [Lentibacter sp.]|uniref:RsmB/NOP family class I SAM-dependent RNA methyltransferase n=1 Tax=Lentibacter sp. TaxID=2024994 RepID=UPI003F6C4BB6